MKKASSSKPARVLDPNDPLHAAVESLFVGLDPRERARKMIEFVEAASRRSPKVCKPLATQSSPKQPRFEP
jgi:hypothetical protein